MENPVRESCVEMMKTLHNQTKQQAEIFLAEQKIHYYIDNRSYLEQISMFKTLLREKRDEIIALKTRYANGYKCLCETE